MISKNAVLAKIAGKHGVSVSYVQKIRDGKSPVNSDKAKAIAASLAQAERARRNFEREVA